MGTVNQDEIKRQELSDFLRTRRARIAPADVGLPAAQVGAVFAADHECLCAGGELCGLTQAGDGADFAKMPIDAGHQQDQAVALAGSLDRCLLVVALDREGDRHVGEDDDVVHREDW